MKSSIPILFCIALLFFSLTLSAQFRPGDIGFDVKEHDIYKKAGVKTQIQKLVDTTFGPIEIVSTISEYTKEGWLYRTTYVQAMEEMNAFEDEGAEVMDTVKDEFTYFPDGRIRIVSLVGYDMFPITYGFEYDKNDQLIASTIAAAESRQYTYEYDGAGNIIKRKGKANMFQYDDEGNLMEGMVWVDYEESEFTWKNKRLIAEKFIMQGEFYYRIDYIYDNKGFLTSYNVYYDDTPGAPPSYSTFYEYDKNGLLKKMALQEEGLRQEYIYEYTYY